MRSFSVGLCLMFVLINGCSPSSDSSVTTEIPTVQRNCSTSRCKSASGSYDGVTVFTLSGCSASTIDYEVIATGSGRVFCDGNNCNGLLNSWRDTNGNPITSFTSRSYYICSYIDFNNSGKDSSDEFSSVQQTVNSSTVLTITSWGASAMQWFL